MSRFILHWAGMDSPSSRQYLFLSGGGAILLAWLAGYAVWRRHNVCAKRWCPRIGRHEFTDPADGVSRKLCHRHHPDVRHRHLTAELIGHIHQRRERDRDGSR